MGINFKGNIREVRTYFTENIPNINGFYQPFLDYVFENADKSKLLSLGVIIADHQWRAAYDAVDPEINSNGMFCKILDVLHG